MKLSAIKVSSRHLVLVIRGHCHRRPNAYTLLLVAGVILPRHPVSQYLEPQSTVRRSAARAGFAGGHSGRGEPSKPGKLVVYALSPAHPGSLSGWSGSRLSRTSGATSAPPKVRTIR